MSFPKSVHVNAGILNWHKLNYLTIQHSYPGSELMILYVDVAFAVESLLLNNVRTDIWLCS